MLLHALASDEAFAQGDVDTGLIARKQTTLTKPAMLSAQTLANAIVSIVDMITISDQTGFTLWQPLTQQILLAQGDQRFECTWQMNGPRDASIETPLGAITAHKGSQTWTLDGIRARPTLCIDDMVYIFGPDGARFSRVDPLDRDSAKGGDSDVISAPMPGLVKSVFIKIGQNVDENQPLCVLEAMKMEHSLLSQRSGVIAEVFVQAGDQVEAGAALIRLEPLEVNPA